VQGEAAPPQIIAALEQFNVQAEPPDLLVLIRGGGSAEDLAAFSTEPVTRAVAASRVPTLAAIGHEVDLSLAELAADKRASTPSNAAELLVPDRRHVLAQLRQDRHVLNELLNRRFVGMHTDIAGLAEALGQGWQELSTRLGNELGRQRQLLKAFDPEAALSRGYALVRQEGARGVVRSVDALKPGDQLDIRFSDGSATAGVTGF